MVKGFLYTLLSGLETFVTIVGYAIASLLLSSGILLLFAKLINAFGINSYFQYYWVFVTIGSSLLVFSITHWYSKLVDVFYDAQIENQPALYHNIIQSDSIPKNTKVLTIALHNKVAMARTFNERSHNLIGRAINWLNMEKPNNGIEINGADFLSLLTLINEKSDTKIKHGNTYFLPLKKAENVLKKLKNL